ncbi:Shedu immune nuclease family protein [Ralstonia mannitolilytica]|uniref:Shedu protein SduA C-terminal domain-containing protein n=1 Tax=Ralstonia mannitolilytica TaxID=105219 RepID=A0AAJ4ZNC6_9RALS|nr:Shedu immune nuclease family protein [Ralstonia mannitolilytica]CAG2149540.1 hypothetical protein LMG6866_03684 [Ralstonia mannitolilytica]CAJ0738022.1 hypothetical protein R77592_04500 [Ralstonia mannitolilytica]SUD89210.1 Uncharacterised protein [Ralstonia mannitolilytica]SUD95160.1 Uncharacterised protein [Ralstonia mannitolilytica]SUD98699.1 Uncharacterised protein [Ralstonia mannitolilytica]
MIEFEAVGEHLHLLYLPRDDALWVYRKFKRGEPLVIKKTFHLTRHDLLSDDVDEVDLDGVGDFDSESRLVEFMEQSPLRFVVATADGEYFRFNADVLGVDVPVLLARDAEPTWKWFTAEQRTSIVGVMSELRPTRIVIGGPASDAIPLDEYVRLIERFPTGYELKRYVLARVAAVVREYTDASVDAEASLRTYVAKRARRKPRDLTTRFREEEEQKYFYLLERLKQMLRSEDAYTEAAWQAEILQIVRLLNPKYIAAFEGVSVKDSVRGGRREIDILLVDASGNVDVIEIKQPFGKSVVTASGYRDNHIPMRELSGSVMQIEKYIFHLNRWGTVGEAALTKRFAEKLPIGFKIQITNPCGIVILGRDNELSEAQRRDFDIVRRKYKSVVDIITYDDLVRRLECVLSQLRARA